MKKAIICGTILSLLLVPMFVFAQGGLEFITGVQGDISTKDVRASAINLINVILGILGIIALIIILYGGFVYMTAGGNEENTTKARQIITAGIIGMIIIIAAYAIARFVVEQLYQKL